ARERPSFAGTARVAPLSVRLRADPPDRRVRGDLPALPDVPRPRARAREAGWRLWTAQLRAADTRLDVLVHRARDARVHGLRRRVLAARGARHRAAHERGVPRARRHAGGADDAL